MAGTCPECLSPSSSGPCPIGDERNCPGMQKARKPHWEMPSSEPLVCIPLRWPRAFRLHLILFFSFPPLCHGLLYTCMSQVLAVACPCEHHQDPKRQTLKPHHSISSPSQWFFCPSPLMSVCLHDACSIAVPVNLQLALCPSNRPISKAATSIP